MSLTPRVNAWIELYDRTDGKLTYGEALRIPMLLADVYRTIDAAIALKARIDAENAKKG